MDQQTLQKKGVEIFSQTAQFVFLNVPKGVQFGFDFATWHTDEMFRGIKMIPEGVHFVFFNVIDKTFNDMAPRLGFFHYFKAGQVVVKKWDPKLESLSDEEVPGSEYAGICNNILLVEPYLAPYPFEILEKWKSLTSHISCELMIKLCPEDGLIRSAAEVQSITDAERPRGRPGGDFLNENNETIHVDKKRKYLLPILKPIEGTNLRLTKIPKHYPDGSSPSEITKHSLDYTYLLTTLLGTYEKELDIIGEMEFCHICFLIGHNLDAFKQWQKLLYIFSCVSEGLLRYQHLYKTLIPVLETQIKETPREFIFTEINDKNNMIHIALCNLFRNVRNSIVIDSDLKVRVENLAKELTILFCWDFSNLDVEEDDEAPIVVDL